jgi:lipopolysaccharide transport system permease protein
MLLFFMSPIFYDPSTVPAQYQPLYRLNPLALLLEAYRAVLMENVQPDWIPLLGLCFFSVLTLYAGLRFFTHVSYRFVEEL